MNSLVRVLAVGVAVIALASCSAKEAGTPGPAEQRTGSPDTSADHGGSPLDGVEPCELLSQAELDDLGVAGGEEANFGDSPGCEWAKTGDFGILVGLNLDIGAEEADLQGATPVPISVGSHDGFRVEAQGGFEGSCAVLVVTSESSFVDISATANGGGDTSKACAKAADVAGLIEPKLP